MPRLHAERGGERFDDRLGLTDGRELAEPRAVVIVRKHDCGDLRREPGLPHAAHSGEGHHPRVVERSGNVCQLPLAADEARGLERQVARECVERSQRCEVMLEIVVTNLEHVFGPLEVAEAVLTEIQKRDVDERVARELSGGVRHHDLTAVRNRHQARGAVGDGPEVVAVAELRGAAVQAHADLERTGRSPRLAAEGTLRVGCRGAPRRRRSRRPRERRRRCASRHARCARRRDASMIAS